MVEKVVRFSGFHDGLSHVGVDRVLRRGAVGLLVALLAFAAISSLSASPAYAAGATPCFRMPFSPTTSWNASTYDSAEKLQGGTWVHAWTHNNYLDLTKVGGGTGSQAARASAPGFARLTNSSEGRVEVDHGGGWKTVYQHMTSIAVNTTGRDVAIGERLGTVSDTGTATGVHLHYAQLRDEVAQAPVFDGIGSYSFAAGTTVGPFTTQSGTYRLLNDRPSTSSLTASDKHCTDSTPDPNSLSRSASNSLAVSDGYLFMSAIGNDGKLYRYRNEASNRWGSNWTSRGAPTGVTLA